jgi:hypothetical protein
MSSPMRSLTRATAFASWSFRLAAGVFFAVVFLLRGFGIAAGTHALYDLLVGLV